MNIKSSRSPRNQATNSMMNDYADILLRRIQDMIDENNKKLTKIDSAIVDSVNSDGSVNIYFPPDNDKIFTNVSNQTPFALQAGDNVEILLKNGLYSNCWVIALHKQDDIKFVLRTNQNIEKKSEGIIESETDLIDRVNENTNNISELGDSVSTLNTRKANLDSPTFIGNPSAPTPDTEDDSTAIATTAFVKAAISAAMS